MIIWPLKFLILGRNPTPILPSLRLLKVYSLYLGGQISYTVEDTVEYFDVRPRLEYRKYIRKFWYAEENPMDLSKTSKEFRDDLSRIKHMTGVDPFELMEIVKDKE